MRVSPRQNTPQPAGPTLFSRLRRWVRRRRRLVAALLLCAAAAVTVQQLTPAPLATTTVLVAARDLAAGATLTDTDLAPQQLPPDAMPDGSFRPGAAYAGQQLSGPLRRGQVLTDAALLGDGLLVGAPPGSQAVPLRLTDAGTVQLVSRGQLVNVVLSSTATLDGPTTNTVLAKKVPVLWTPVAPSSSGLLPSQENDGLVVVAANEEQAAVLAGASARGKIFLVLVS